MELGISFVMDLINFCSFFPLQLQKDSSFFQSSWLLWIGSTSAVVLGIINHRNNNLLDHSLVVMNNTREWGNEGCEKRSVTLYNTKYFLVTTKNLDGIRYFFNFNCLYDMPCEFIYIISTTLFNQISCGKKIVKHKIS